MTKAHRQRGVVTERAVVTWLRGNGYPHAERSVRTGYRVAGRELPDVGDIDGTPGVAWQVKALTDRREGRNPAAAAEACVVGWMMETEQQRVAASATLGVLIVRRDGWASPGNWWAFVPAVDFLMLAGGMGLALVPLPLQGQLVDDERARTPLMPVRLELGDLALLLRSWGLGDPLAGGLSL